MDAEASPPCGALPAEPPADWAEPLCARMVVEGISRGGGLLECDGEGEGEWDAFNGVDATSVEDPFCRRDLEIPDAGPSGRSPPPFGVFFKSSGEDTLIEGVPIAVEDPLPAARDKPDRGCSFGLV